MGRGWRWKKQRWLWPDCRGDRVAEPKITAALLVHLLVSTRELLQNQLIDTAHRPGLLIAAAKPYGDQPGRGA